jgi:DNA-binding transcriptional ArsR family regulator
MFPGALYEDWHGDVSLWNEVWRESGAYDRVMKTTMPDIAQLAAVIGDPARARMLSALLGGSLTATDLAIRAGVASSTASAHLNKLTGGGDCL